MDKAYHGHISREKDSISSSARQTKKLWTEETVFCAFDITLKILTWIFPIGKSRTMGLKFQNIEKHRHR